MPAATAPRKLNVLVYTGTGTTAEPVRHALTTLRRLLTPNYAVTPVTESALIKEPWPQTCALLVFPGGADLGYCRALDGSGATRRIADYVRRGGAYLGFCAGGYFGSSRCEFEVGSSEPGMEVIGPRSLRLFPGTCRGAAFGGFRYRSENGARAARLRIEQASFRPEDGAPERATSYFNGGGVFVDAASLRGKGVEVLASYEDEIAVDGGEAAEDGKEKGPSVDSRAAAVYCKVGNGAAILTGPHPEFAAANIGLLSEYPGHQELVEALAADDHARSAFLKACLRKLDLVPNEDDIDLPTLTPLHLSSINHTEAEELLHSFGDILTLENDNEEYIRAEADSFRLDRGAKRWSAAVRAKTEKGLDGLSALSLGTDSGSDAGGKLSADGSFIDYADVVKEIVPHETAWPHPAATPDFHHDLFYQCLRVYRAIEDHAQDWGDLLMYCEVTTSTCTILDKNPKLLGKLPTGFTLAASNQVAARGRSSNVWVCPAGSLVFSVVINHPVKLATSRPLVFLQYLAAIAVVEAVKSYDIGYEDMPLRVKWPNDIYARDPSSTPSKPSYVKIGGILSTCNYLPSSTGNPTGGAYQCVLGIGINAANQRPTTSLNALLPALGKANKSGRELAPFRLEKLLARVLTRLEALHSQFLREGFSRGLENRYYRHWLHSGQEITLEAEGSGSRARVVGITRDWGLLEAVEIDGVDGRETGRKWALQSDENSFDYWKGLVRRKV